MIQISSFFKKTKPQQIETQVIEKIHNHFDTAADEALREAKEVLAYVTDKTNDEYAQKLISLGFLQSDLVTKTSAWRNRKNNHKRRADIVMKWRVKYPQYKLIFLDQVEDVCNKYGLILSDAFRYKGTIPKKNIDEIAAFKIDEADDLYIEPGYSNDYYGVTKKCESMNHEYGGRSYVRQHKKCGFFICAPAKDISLKHNEKIVGNKIVIEDPIVLKPIEEKSEAFLIVSKWGLEAGDPSLTNEIEN